jgi:hypothetical protein
VLCLPALWRPPLAQDISWEPAVAPGLLTLVGALFLEEKQAVWVVKGQLFGTTKSLDGQARVSPC